MQEETAYTEAIRFAKNHYENFPVVSLLVQKKLRKHIAVIYWFARTADDIADEGNIFPDERITKLNLFEKRFRELVKGNCSSAFEAALFNTIKEKNLSSELFLDLLKAFKQDVVKKKYKNFEDILDYCRYSANPVGRLILELYGIHNEEAFSSSDKICTALQLTNFYQDTAVDFEKGRIYLPQDEMEKFNVSEKSFELKENNLNLQQLLKYNIDRTADLFSEGKRLFDFLKGRLKLEIKWTVLGGEKILEKIIADDYNVLNNRPVLEKTDFIFLMFKSFFL